MEVVFKLPKGKPPFMGIVFESAHEASKYNQDLVNYYKDCSFKALIEVSESINLKLVCDEPPLNREYKDLRFDHQKFVAWLYYAEDKRFNFSHIIKQNEKEIVVKTLKDQKLFVLSIEKFRLYDIQL